MMMKRRTFLTTSAAFAALPPFVRAANSPTAPFVLSTSGCGRATGYAETNKIITQDGHTHVSWLDSEPDKGFQVRIRSLNHETGSWGDTVTIGSAHDNHGGPALTIDRGGYLHIVYGPHHHPMSYRKSLRPNDATEWEAEIQFGERLTYPTLVCDSENNLVFTCRRSHSDKPWEMELWTKPAASGEPWQFQQTVAQSRHKGYAHFQEGLAWGPDHSTLHLFGRFHEKTDKGSYGRIQTVAYLQSPDGGKSWQRMDGQSVELPVTAETVDVIASGGKDFGSDLRIGGIAILPDGKPVVAYSRSAATGEDVFLARPDADGKWDSLNLRKFLPASYQDWKMITPGCLTLAANGELRLVAQLHKSGPEESSWGHPSNEVCLLRSRDRGANFAFELVSKPDPGTPHWLPNLERPTGYNQISATTGLIYTRGNAGAKNTEIVSNEVLWQPIG